MPNDAIVAGKAPNGENTYIGQMTIQNPKLNGAMEYLPGTITRGQISVVATYEGRIVKSDNNSNTKVSTSANTKFFLIL